ncbi:MAG: propane 2-monooxygenase small subunit, partial [Pseudonocardiales bacterium]|nr:propane 2-monooxygenase small subunit [Pseudonocardiales bacterium]
DDAEWQGVREVTEALTAIEDDWGESMFATNIVFEPLLGELFRSNLVQQCAAANGDFVTPTIVGANEYDYSQRDLRWTEACFGPLTEDKEFADHNKAIMQGWLSHWVPRCLEAARTMAPLWSVPDVKPRTSEHALERAIRRFAGIVTDLGLEPPKEATR